MANNTDNGQGCLGCLAIVFLILGFTHPGWWVALFILIVSAPNSQSSSSNTSSSSSSNTSSSTSTILPDLPDDLNNILIDISSGEIKDPVTQEIFRPGEQVYLCYTHKLAYHEDSWREMGCKCMVCGNNAHTKLHTLPVPVQIKKRNTNDLQIEFRQLE
ncbi:hypothetical protein [Argonema antarcticum]|uniref:hypothetical protein n=1 Tax=Argonema antarcticum TaxID=2942763 RepID=UPI0020139CE3|nr:hypothetical protein [Argonema antarcticum]MCL1471001.1 hypothetical protein [Argonema antarcticum A004/B2]